jgi:hypothetical protein
VDNPMDGFSDGPADRLANGPADETDRRIALEYEVAPFWRIVDRVRRNVRKTLAERPEEFRDAAAMTASELVENAVKYSASNGKGPSRIRFEMAVDESRVRIAVSNRVASPENRAELRSAIERIREVGDPRFLFVGRMYDLMNRPVSERTRLGLYRIAYEGGFVLDCRFDGDRATVIAAGPIQPPKGQETHE